MRMRLPAARGPVSAALFAELARPPHELPGWLRRLAAAGGSDPLSDADLQVSLFACYELHYRGMSTVDERWEWEPSLLAVRAVLERRLEAGLRALVPPVEPVPAAELPRALAHLAAADDGPPLAGFLQRTATLTQFREFVLHRSLYHLKEADPHTWAIPRLAGPAKAALVEIQADEYGGGRPDRMHAELFRQTMVELDLDAGYGAHVDLVPAVTLAGNTALSLFALHRRWLGALLGHLAALEMTSSLPNRRYGNGLRRLGYGPAATRFYDEHVEADAVHEQVAAHDLCGRYAAEHPDRIADMLFGASCCLALDRLLAEHLLGCWSAGRSSLGAPSAAAESA
jgi:Iron-containing redox enzyme